MRFFSGVSNYKETPYIVSDTFANKVNYSATIKGAVYIARDGASVSEPSIYQANGSTWVPIGGYGIGTDATLQDVTDNGATSNDILKLTGADGIYVDVPNKQFSLGAGNFVNSDTQGFQMVDNTYKIGDIFELHTKTKLLIDDDDLFIKTNSDTFSILNNANTLDIANFSIAGILLTDNSGATANTLRMYLGNVGIFTTSPTYKLDVHANGNNSNQGIGLRNTNAGSSATASIFLGNNTADNQARIFLNSTTNTANGGSNSLNLGTTQAANVSFFTANAEKMRLISSGALLINNTTDNLSGAKLQVTGAVTTSGNITSDGVIFLRTASSIKGAIFTDATNLILQTIAGVDIDLQAATVSRLKIAALTGAVTLSNLAGTGSRAVLADANGVLSAPVSDISVKENIEPLSYGIAEIMALNPVSFEFIKGYKNYGEGKQFGNIAQDVYNVIPEAVFTTPSTGKMGINYDQFNGIYIKALQQLQEQIFELKAELNFLKNK